MTTPDDLTTLDAADFARFVAATPEAELTAAMASERREAILTEIFHRFVRHFRAEKAQNVDLAMHFVIGGRPDGGDDRWEVVLRDGTCAVNAQPQHQPGVTVTCGPVAFLKLVSGNANAVSMFMQGKLRLQGDMMAAMNALQLFDIPSA